MSLFRRIALLVGCGALGIGAAVYVAARLPDEVVVEPTAPVVAHQDAVPEVPPRPAQPATVPVDRPALAQPAVAERVRATPPAMPAPEPRATYVAAPRAPEPSHDFHAAAVRRPIAERMAVQRRAPPPTLVAMAPSPPAGIAGVGGDASLLDGLDGPTRAAVEAFARQLNQNPAQLETFMGNGQVQQLLQSNPEMFRALLGNPAVQQSMRQALENPDRMNEVMQAFQQGGIGLPGGGQLPQPGPAGAAPPAAAEKIEPKKDEPKMFSYSEGDNELNINIADKDIREVLQQLSKLGGLNILVSNSVEGKVSAVVQNVDINAALDAILRSTGYVAERDGKFIYVGKPEDFIAMRTAADRVGTRIYRPNYITAKELQTFLTPLLSNGVGKISVTSPATVGIAVDTSGAGGDNFASGEAVLVQDYEAVLAEIDQIVRELDARPLQVSIEAMVLSVTLNDKNKFGVDFQLLRNQQHVRFGTGTPRVEPLNGAGTANPQTGGTVGEFRFDGGGLKFAFLDSSLGAFITALETIGDTNIIATPRLMCLNKQKAEILIGAQIGYQTTTVTQTFSTQTVQFLDVGTQLRLRPYISTDGTIRMEVHPELSTGSVSPQGIPSKNVTQVTTNIMCQDGSTVVIGGLMQESLQTDINQVPLIGSMPVIGPLFRTKADQTTRNEVLVLITPRIVYDPEYNQDSVISQEDYTRRHAVVSDSRITGTKVVMSRRYVARAEDAAQAGDTRRALRLARLAVHIDPENREAIRLRERLIASLGPGAPPEPGFAAPVPGSNPLDTEEISPGLLDDLEGVAPPPELPRYPRDPGQPGYQRPIVRPDVLRNEGL